MAEIVPIENELQRLPPRAIKNREGRWGELKPFLVFLIPHVWIAVAAPIVLCLTILLALSSESFPGTVTELRESYTRKGGTTYNVRFNFKVENQVINSNSSVSEQRYRTIANGDSIAVHALRIAPGFFPQLEKSCDSLWPAIAAGGAWTLVWCLFVFSFVWGTLAQPLLSRYLVKYGSASRATLQDIVITRNRNRNQYLLLYTFPAKVNNPQTGKACTQTFNGKMKLRSADYASALELKGHQSTVLFDHHNPKRSILYRFCNHSATL